MVLSLHAADDDTFIDHHFVEVLIHGGVLSKLDTGRLHLRLVIAVLILLLYLREEGLGAAVYDLLLCQLLSVSGVR